MPGPRPGPGPAQPAAGAQKLRLGQPVLAAPILGLQISGPLVQLAALRSACRMQWQGMLNPSQPKNFRLSAANMLQTLVNFFFTATKLNLTRLLVIDTMSCFSSNHSVQPFLLEDQITGRSNHRKPAPYYAVDGRVSPTLLCDVKMGLVRVVTRENAGDAALLLGEMTINIDRS